MARDELNDSLRNQGSFGPVGGTMKRDEQGHPEVPVTVHNSDKKMKDIGDKRMNSERSKF